MSRLQCPYPGCKGEFHESRDRPEQLFVCPECHRPSARCDHGPHGARCQALNRPLARFCRYCGQEQLPGWAQARWAHDLDSEVAPGASLVLGHAEPVLYLEDHSVSAVNELCEVAGRIWVGTADGRFLLVDPFSDQHVPLTSQRAWGGDALQFRTSGIWLLLYSKQGIKYLDLLPLDEPRGSLLQLNPTPLWTASERRLLSRPVLLRLPADRQNAATGLDRVVAWVSSGPNGPSLWSATLSLVRDQVSPPQEWPLAPLSKDALSSLHEDERIALVEAADGARDHLVVCSRESLGLVTFLPASAAPGTRVGPPRYFPIMSKEERQRRQLQFIANVHEVPGVVAVPTLGSARSRSGSGDEVWGTVYVAAHAGEDSARQELHAISCPRRGRFQDSVEGEGMPLEVEGFSGNRRVLVLAGHSLVLHNDLGNRTPVLDLPDLLPLVHRFQVAGRVAVCSGIDASTGHARWFTQLIDLRDGRLVPDKLTAEQPTPNPLLLGRYLFAVERVAVPGRPRASHGEGPVLCLTRRRLAPRSAGRS